MSNALVTKDKNELEQIGHEIQTLLPGGQKLTRNQAIALGKYAQLTKANPFRGEVYGYQGKNGELALVDGYKQLVRWAERVSKFDDNYTLIPVGEEGLEDGDIGYRCTIMRHDQKEQIREYVQMGATFSEAYDLVSSSAVGVVRKSETYSNKWNRPIDPPSGWTWDQVARKRALKNVINLAFPMPSIDELAAEEWTVGGVETQEEDWEIVAEITNHEQKRAGAKRNALHREWSEERANMSHDELREKVQRNIDLMRGPADDDVLADDEEVEEGEIVKDDGPTDPATAFWTYVNESGIDKEAAKQIIHETGGDIDQALVVVKGMDTPPQQPALLEMPEAERTGYEEGE